MLYVSSGDGGYANDWGIGHNVTLGNGQDTAALNGKILRIDPNADVGYTVPKDNPFVGNSNYAPEIWATGFRNPWRCSFDHGRDQGAVLRRRAARTATKKWTSSSRAATTAGARWKASHCFDYVNPNTHPANCNKTGHDHADHRVQELQQPDVRGGG